MVNNRIWVRRGGRSSLSSYVVSSGEGDLGTYKPAKHTGCQLDRVLIESIGGSGLTCIEECTATYLD